MGFSRLFNTVPGIFLSKRTENKKAKNEQPKQTQAITETMATTAIHEQRAANANAASITAAKPVAHGAVPLRIECCCALKNRLLYMASNVFVKIIFSSSSGWVKINTCTYQIHVSF